MSNETTNYETPRVTDHGDLVKLTATQAGGQNFDTTKPQPGFVLSGGTGGVNQPSPMTPR